MDGDRDHLSKSQRRKAGYDEKQAKTMKKKGLVRVYTGSSTGVLLAVVDRDSESNLPAQHTWACRKQRKSLLWRCTWRSWRSKSRPAACYSIGRQPRFYSRTPGDRPLSLKYLHNVPEGLRPFLSPPPIKPSFLRFLFENLCATLHKLAEINAVSRRYKYEGNPIYRCQSSFWGSEYGIG